MKKLIITILLFIVTTSAHANMTKSEVMELWKNDEDVIRYRQQITVINNQVNALLNQFEQDKNAISAQNPWASPSALMTLTNPISSEFTKKLNTLNAEHALVSYNLDIANYKYKLLLESIKSYSTYATLQEYNNSEAVVSYLDPTGSNKESKITVYSCYSLGDYVGWRVVLNFMDDEILNSGDYIIFGTSNDSCSISYVSAYLSTITNIETVPSCGKNSSLSNGKCSCLSWYAWEYPDNASNYDCKLKVTFNNTTSVTLKKKAQLQFDKYKKQYASYSKLSQKYKYQGLLIGFQKKAKALKWDALIVNKLIVELINSEISKL